MECIFCNILGCFVFDNQLRVIDKIVFKDCNDFKDNKDKAVEKLKGRNKSVREADAKDIQKIISYFKNNEFFDKFRSSNISFTKESLKESVKDDVLIIQAVHSLAELDIVTNKLAKVMREWFELNNPELSKKVQSHYSLAKLIAGKNDDELLKEAGVSRSESLGAEVQEDDFSPIKNLADELKRIYELKEMQENYLERIMEKFCRNLAVVAGINIGARLIAEAGSMKRLSEVPSSTVQVYGAEKALFRHMKTGAKMPRHGLIANHPLIMQAEQKMHGKTARALADKISIAAKVDYFMGKFVGDELKKGLIEKFGVEY